ncbi:MAG TPA: TetR/AcrR family transcriptional regulator [Accumulibacter sp.]|nr:TetR/AcrR family transcriptional regulator [Accumulibacter sp.]HMW17807.1 TetR/AcrR family transcriptional regulator [Accumulibacter sp.]HMX21758.1 TetR/AcrR family transcriptional regulator [Accumulibacter sp.]HMY06303.1 TetR/AcrR family transcriptional regulator [Accumulibacter sp.]HNC17747.1 TetR/AcrR family transcriptional regulator [Accumulibacter sp.]
METKPKRRTRERIIETSLRLFNDFGEPNVTTAFIADEMDISPGNLYYHFHRKDEIVDAIFTVFHRELNGLLAMPGGRAHVEDFWLFVHLLFEQVWKYRFIYRDLNDLLTRNRQVEIGFKQILAQQVRTTVSLCEGLIQTGAMLADPGEVRTLAINMSLITTYWLSYEYSRDPRGDHYAARIGRGVYQAMSLIAPYLLGDSRLLLERLSEEYIDR